MKFASVKRAVKFGIGIDKASCQVWFGIMPPDTQTSVKGQTTPPPPTTNILLVFVELQQ